MSDFRNRDRIPLVWKVLPGLTPYAATVAAMHAEMEKIIAGVALEQIWLLESPPGYNRGIHSRPEHLTGQGTIAVEPSPEPHHGGSYSYHGPGVRMGFVMLNLAQRRKDLDGFVAALHAWLIAAVGKFGIAAAREAFDPAGVWAGNDKIAAIGLRMKRWVTGYGFALHVNPDLSHFAGIIPCGVPGKGITSLAQLGVAATMAEVDAVLLDTCDAIFGPITVLPPGVTIAI